MIRLRTHIVNKKSIAVTIINDVPTLSLASLLRKISCRESGVNEYFGKERKPFQGAAADLNAEPIPMTMLAPKYI